MNAKPNFFTPGLLTRGIFENNAVSLLKEVEAEIERRAGREKL